MKETPWRIPHGTLHVVIGGCQRVLIAADSRAMSGNKLDGDNFQKVFQSGKQSICGASGAVTLDRGRLYVSDRIGAICANEHLQDRPRELLQCIATDLRGPLSANVAKHYHPDDDGMIFEAYSIRRHVGGAIELAKLQFPLTIRADGSPLLSEPEIREFTPRIPFVYHLGHGDCLTKKLEQQLNVDRLSDEELLKGIDRIFETARQENDLCGAEIGGPIDVAAIDSGGFHWLRKKPAVVRTASPAMTAGKRRAMFCGAALELLGYIATAYLALKGHKVIALTILAFATILAIVFGKLSNSKLFGPTRP